MKRAMSLFAFAWMVATAAAGEDMNSNEPGILEPMTSYLEAREVRVPNTDQSIDGREQSTVHGAVIYEDALATTSLLGHPITHLASPNDDMRFALARMAAAARGGEEADLRDAAAELMDILLGTTEGRIYDGFSMLNYNRWNDAEAHGVGPEHFPPDVVPGEYKMKVARDTGETFVSPFDGEERRIWEVDVALLYYDGQIDSDTFLLRFPVDAHDDDTVRINYRIYAMSQEDFSPTLVMLDRRMALNTVQFPFKGFDAVWIAFNPGQIVNVTVKYPPVRMVRGVYTWGWRVHPPRIQFLQPIYEMVNAHTGEVELDPQGKSFAVRNRDDLTIDTIGDAAPEKKMYEVARAVLDGAHFLDVFKWLTDPRQGPRGTWIDWADLAQEQRQLPPEVWDLLADDGLTPTFFGDYEMVSVFLNNEMYGEGPGLNEILGWDQGETFKVKLFNLDRHTHYFRNVDFSTRLHDDILRCCGGGATSFEIMNFKPSYGAPKVAEMQWRAGWGFRPHYDVVQQQHVFPRASDRVKLRPYTSGLGDTYYGYQYSEEARGGDFRFSPPPFVITDVSHPAPFPLKDTDGEAGLVIGRRTEGYGTGQMCPGDPWPGFCTADIAAHNPHGVRNFPPPPLQGQPVLDADLGKFPGDVYPDAPVELRFPPFLRNPDQGEPDAGDIIPPTGAWRPFLWINPANGSLFIDPDNPEKGHWADLTYSHGAPVYAGGALDATIELPRASGQVFYQFDDLFHDNSIFSPHPLFEGESEADEVVHLRAFLRNFVRVRGRLAPLPNGQRAEWVSLYDGPAGASGCTGNVLASSPVDPDKGFFVFRCGNRCLSPLAEKAIVLPGAKLCVQSPAGGFAEAVIEP